MIFSREAHKNRERQTFDNLLNLSASRGNFVCVKNWLMKTFLSS